MSSLFKKPKALQVIVPQQVASEGEKVVEDPAVVEAEAQAKAQEENLKFQKKRSRSKTLLTGPSGIEEKGATKTLLG